MNTSFRVEQSHRSLGVHRTALSLGVGLALAGAASLAEAYSCLAMTQVSIANVTITSATDQPMPNASGPLDNYCQVDGYILTPGLNGEVDNQVRFRVALPEKIWNGKLLVEGNGAHAGAIPGFSALGRGYAEAGTDTGHVGSTFGNMTVATYDGRWAGHSATRQADFGYRAVHATTDVAKALVGAFYTQAPMRSYFNGCSLGGRQAWMEIQRYPQDFDGVLAGASFNNYSVAKMELNWNQRWQLRDANHYVPQTKLINVGHASVAACDAIDGVVDGLIDDPRKCNFDPAALLCTSGDSPRCLSSGQVETMKMVYQGARTSGGSSITPGFMPGGEDTAGTADVWLSSSTPVVKNADGTLSYGASPANEFLSQDQFFTFMAWGPSISDYNWRSFNFDTDPQNMGYTEATYSAMNTNLVPFMSNGGKVIAYHGWSDWAISPLLSIDWYTRVQNAMGDTSQFYRLFMVPGMGHCGGGPGPNSADYLTALENWVEKGIAPDSIVATHTTSTGVVDRTRPLCTYPKVARYKGTGGFDDAANFACVNP